MALPYAYDSTKQVSNYSQDAMKRRLNKQPNQFTAGGMQPLGGQQALNGVEGEPQSAQPAQEPTMAPPTSAPSPTPVAAPNYYEQQQAMAATRTTPTGTVTARAKGNNGGDGNGGGGKGDGGGGGNNNGGNNNNNGGNNNGGGGKGDGKKGERPWYLRGLNMKDKGDAKIANFLRTDPTFQQQVNDFLASREDQENQFSKQRKLIKTDFDRDIKGFRYDRDQNWNDLANAMGSSGLMRSSGYSDEYGNVESEYAQDRIDRVSDRNFGLQENKANNINFLRQLEIMQQQAKAEALRRRAAENFSFGGMV